MSSILVGGAKNPVNSLFTGFFPFTLQHFFAYTVLCRNVRIPLYLLKVILQENIDNIYI